MGLGSVGIARKELRFLRMYRKSAEGLNGFLDRGQNSEGGKRVTKQRLHESEEVKENDTEGQDRGREVRRGRRKKGSISSEHRVTGEGCCRTWPRYREARRGSGKTRDIHRGRGETGEGS